MVKVFDILRPVVTGLVSTAALLLVANCLWGADRLGAALLRVPELRATFLVALSFALTAFTKISPVSVLLGGAAAGLAFGFFSV